MVVIWGIVRLVSCSSPDVTSHLRGPHHVMHDNMDGWLIDCRFDVRPLRLIVDILRFNYIALSEIRPSTSDSTQPNREDGPTQEDHQSPSEGDTETVERWLVRRGFSEIFRDYYLVVGPSLDTGFTRLKIAFGGYNLVYPSERHPSASPDQDDNRGIVRYGPLEDLGEVAVVYNPRGLVRFTFSQILMFCALIDRREYVKWIERRVGKDKIHLGVGVEEVIEGEEGVEVVLENGTRRTFDHVILAYELSPSRGCG